MPTQEKIILHALPPSHPCMTAEAGLKYKGLEYDRVELTMGSHGTEVDELYGEGARTVPGMMIGDEAVHGSVPILRRLEEMVPEKPLYPEPIAEGVRAAEEWADGHFQDLGRRLPWGALHFRPEAMGTFAGGDALDPAGTDFAMKFIHSTWKYHRITAVKLAEDLAGFSSQIRQIEEYAGQGLIGSEEPTAADLQIASTVRVLLTIGDLHPMFDGTAAERIAIKHFPDYDGLVPEGAYPAGWLK